jgi:hypothetical protein
MVWSAGGTVMTQPEALRLADHLEREYYVPAAYELRRLYADNEKKSEAIQRLWKERDELRAQRDALLEALEKIANVNAMDKEYQAWARAAIAKAEGKT